MNFIPIGVFLWDVILLLLISLIPKVKEPQNLGEYHPISLVGCMYKILTKILGRRLKSVAKNN